MIKNHTHPSKSCPRKLLIIDGHAVAFYCWFSNYLDSIIPGVLKKISQAIDEHSPSHIVVAFDPKPPTFRHNLYPAYKANRPPVPKKFLDECKHLFKILESIRIPFYELSGYEADDVIGTCVTHFSQIGFDSVILTCDLDLLQLTNHSVQVEVFSQYWPTRIFDQTAAKRRFGGIEPINIPDFKALAGDRSDNLPGIVGIGSKSATSLLLERGDLEGIYEDLDSVLDLNIRGAKRIHQLLESNRQNAYIMRDLATIVRDAPLSIDPKDIECGIIYQDIQRVLEDDY